MAHFRRRNVAPVVTGGYRSFRSYVREDFIGQCAYCLLAEFLAGGEENFELDHFRPKARFSELEESFFNLYYSCHPCNKTKRDRWPPASLEARGIGFVDLCADDFSQHFSAGANGEWDGKTESGCYTIDAIRLNRKHLVEMRRLLSRLGFEMHRASVSDEELSRLAERLTDLSDPQITE